MPQRCAINQTCMPPHQLSKGVLVALEAVLSHESFIVHFQL
jgi:hypothetical protein